IDLYQHMVRSLTGQWSPPPDAHPAWRHIAEVLNRAPFSCSLVDGNFTHIGTTSHYRTLFTEQTAFSELYEAHQRLGPVHPTGPPSAGVIVDSTLAGGGELLPAALVIECDLGFPVRAARGAILHGLTGLREAIDVPENTVVHQLPIRLPTDRRGVTIRVYGVADNPKQTIKDGGIWFGRPILEILRGLGLHAES